MSYKERNEVLHLATLEDKDIDMIITSEFLGDKHDKINHLSNIERKSRTKRHTTRLNMYDKLNQEELNSDTIVKFWYLDDRNVRLNGVA